VCVPGQPPGVPAGVPSSAAEALAGLEASLGYLAGADVANWPVDALAGCLRALGRAESAQVAARSRAMAAFNAQGGFEADGQPTIRTWLRWQTQVTTGASHAAAGWMKRLAVHPRVLAALAAAQVTASFARLICDASDLLVPELRDEADEILLAAAAGGATEADLAMLAQEMRERSAPPDTDATAPTTGMTRTGSPAGGCSWTCTSAAGESSTATSRPSALPRWPRCWRRWGRGPGRRTPGRRCSASTMRWRRRPGG
jgi:hypothetical protein